METYMTIEEVAAYLKLAPQTIRKFILNKSIPYRKVQKSVRFRLSEIEQWIDRGGGGCRKYKPNDRGTATEPRSGEGSPLAGDLFAGVDAAEAGEACCPSAADSNENKETGEVKA